jgi:hypothetical protein
MAVTMEDGPSGKVGVLTGKEDVLFYGRRIKFV